MKLPRFIPLQAVRRLCPILHNQCSSLTVQLATDRSIPLGLLSYPYIVSKDGILVHWLDLNWWSTGVLCLGGLCSRFAVSGAHHVELPGLLYPDKMARYAFLLACLGLLNLSQYLGFQDIASHKYHSW